MEQGVVEKTNAGDVSYLFSPTVTIRSREFSFFSNIFLLRRSELVSKARFTCVGRTMRSVGSYRYRCM